MKTLIWCSIFAFLCTGCATIDKSKTVSYNQWTVKLPQGWVVNEQPGGDSGGIEIGRVLTNDINGETNGVVSLSINPIGNETSEDWLKIHVSPVTPGDKISDEVITQFGGMQGKGNKRLGKDELMGGGEGITFIPNSGQHLEHNVIRVELFGDPKLCDPKWEQEVDYILRNAN